MIQPDTTQEKPNACCTEENLEYDFGDGVEWEVWTCNKCDSSYTVAIEIVRYFDTMEKNHSYEEEYLAEVD
tara:strand:+ start:337 stop:549 length:213 start_codon:yes stop_codon:yes gene_type:complete